MLNLETRTAETKDVAFSTETRILTQLLKTGWTGEISLPLEGAHVVRCPHKDGNSYILIRPQAEEG